MPTKPLSGQIAVVAGATRGAGRGIARMLGEAGATVYCGGRSSRGQISPSARPQTIEETADLVTAPGGVGIAVRTDRSELKDDPRWAPLMDRIATSGMVGAPTGA